VEFPERSLSVLHFSEPALEFGLGQTAVHPKDGLFLYGPHNRARGTKEIRIGVIGAAEGIGYFRTWAAQIKKRIGVPPQVKARRKIDCIWRTSPELRRHYVFPSMKENLSRMQSM
jgi:hypothetical protein